MAEITSVAGTAREATPEQAEVLADIGSDIYKPVSKETGLAQTQREADIKLADTYHPAIKAGTGVLQGMTLGMGLPLMIKGSEALGIGDPYTAAHALRGFDASSDAYMAGKLAGFGVGTIATHGLLDEAGAAIGLGKLIPEAAGISGQAIRGAATVGTRGAMEGAAMGLGKAVEDSVLQNKALTSEAILISMGEGALIGGGLGVVLGSAGGALRGAIGSETAKSLAERYVAKKAGLSGIVKEIGPIEGGLSQTVRRASEELEAEGVKLTSSPEAVLQASRKVEQKLSRQVADIASEFDRAGAKAPVWTDFAARARQEIVGEIMMAPGGVHAAESVNRALDKLVPMPSQSGKMTSFSGWVKGRQAILDAGKSLPGELGTKLTALYDSMLRDSMSAAEHITPSLTGASGRYQAAQLGSRIMKVVADSAEGRIGQPGGLLGAHDLSTAGAIGLTGHPLSAAGYLAGRAGSRFAMNAVAPEIANLVLQTGANAKAVAAVTALKRSVKSAVAGIFGSAVKSSVSYAVPSRKDFNKELERVYQFAGKAKQERVNNYIRHTESMALASGVESAADRAVGNLMKDIPQADVTRSMNSLRKKALPKTLNVKEHMFYKKLQATKSPLAVLDSMAHGNASKEQIGVLKNSFPETYGLVVSEVQDKISELKQSGHGLPTEKIVQLSLLLDSPMDSIMRPEFVTPVQMAQNEPPQQNKPPQPQNTQSNDESYETPTEQMI